jgi:maltooligosyltrehalose synthase
LLRGEDNIVFDAGAWHDTSVAIERPNLVNLFMPSAARSDLTKLGESFSAFPVALLVSPELAKSV